MKQRGTAFAATLVLLLGAAGGAAAATKPGERARTPATGRKAPPQAGPAATAVDPASKGAPKATAEPPPKATSKATAPKPRAEGEPRTPADDLDVVRSLAAEGRAADAERLCSKLLAANPGRTDVLLERARLRAQEGKLAEARVDFNEVLVLLPADTTALSGLGYTLAWSGDLDTAEWTFRRALEVDPGTLDAEKGLAYVALWRGDAADAARRFDVLARTRPDNAELLVGLGQALQADGRRSEARAAFEQALAVEPRRADALAGRQATASHRRAEVTVLGGVSLDSADPEPFGVRFAELAAAPAERLRLSARYDDASRLDDAALAEWRADAAAVWAGGLLAWHGRDATRLELGWRRLDGGVDEAMARAEQAIGLGAVALRLGGWVGAREDHRVESAASGGVTVFTGRVLRIEPTVLWGKGGDAGGQEVRGVLAAIATSSTGGELGLGVGGGRAYGGEVEGAVWSGYFKAVLPLGGRVRAQLLLSHERPASGPSLTVYALGASVSGGAL